MIDIYDLKGRVYIITGGSGLLGMKHAEAILEANGVPVLFDINSNVESKAKELEKRFSTKVLGLQVDITDETAIRKGLVAVLKECGSVYGIINNAAFNPKMDNNTMLKDNGRLETFTMETWDRDMSISVTGAFLMCKVIGPLLAKQGDGVIINISSDLGLIAPDQRIYRQEGENADNQAVKPVTYSVVKHALIGLTKYLSTYWAHRGVRANSISPSGIQTDSMDPKFVEKLSTLIPMGRMATPDEYKGAIQFLCSDASRYMNGANLVMDGGRTVW